MNVSKIKSFFLENKKSLFYAVFFLFSFFLFSDLAFAIEPNSGAWADKDTNLIDDAIKGVNFLLIIASGLLGATTSLVSLFLTPGWVNGTIFGLDWYMKSIWILVSNVVYFIFAFLLIVIAFMNIIGKWDKWELKSALPKFIVWVVMVPFTWFFVQFILSISAILTVWVLTLPYDSFGWTPEYEKVTGSFTEMIGKIKWEWNTDDEPKELPTTFILNLSENIVDKDDGTTWFKKSEEFFKSWNPQTVDSILKWENEPNSIFGIIFLYTYGVMQIHELDSLSEQSIATAIGSITDLSLKLIFDTLFVLVYMILMIALFLALLVRGIKLWVYAMLSPTFGLLYFFDKADGVGDGNGKFGIKDFISLALVPVYVSAALSFGLLFIMVANHGMWTSSILWPCATEDVQWMNVSTTDLTCMKVPGWFTFAIQWAHNKAPTWNAIGKIIMQLFGIVILWMSVMTALKQSEITNKITEPIQQFGWNIGNLVAKSPLYAPVIPWGISIQWAQQLSSMAKTHYEWKAIDSWRDFANKYGLFGWTTSGEWEKIASEIRNQTALDKDLMNKIRAELWNFGTVADVRWNAWAKQMLTALASKLDIEEIKLDTDRWVAKALHDIQNKTYDKTNWGWGIFGSRQSNNDGVNDVNTRLAWMSWSRDNKKSGDDKSPDGNPTGSTTQEKASFVMSPDWNNFKVDLSLPQWWNKTILIKDKTMDAVWVDDLSRAISQGLEPDRVNRILVEINDKQNVVNQLSEKLKDKFTISLNNKWEVIIIKK